MRPRCQKMPQFILVPGNRLLLGCVWCTNGISFAAMQSISVPPECLLNWGPGHARGCVCLQQPHPWSSQPCPTCASEETHISLFIQLVVAQNSMHVFFFNTCKTHVEWTITTAFGGLGFGLGLGLGGATSLRIAESRQKSKKEKAYFLFRLKTQIIVLNSMQGQLQQRTCLDLWGFYVYLWSSAEVMTHRWPSASRPRPVETSLCKPAEVIERKDRTERGSAIWNDSRRRNAERDWCKKKKKIEEEKKSNIGPDQVAGELSWW